MKYHEEDGCISEIQGEFSMGTIWMAITPLTGYKRAMWSVHSKRPGLMERQCFWRASLVAQRWRIRLQCRRCGLIPGSGRSPGGKHRNPLQESCLENPQGQRSLVSYSPRGLEEWDTVKQPGSSAPKGGAGFHENVPFAPKLVDKWKARSQNFCEIWQAYCKIFLEKKICKNSQYIIE